MVGAHVAPPVGVDRRGLELVVGLFDVVAPRLDALHAAWQGFEVEERLLHLRSLPRDVCPRPFRDDLVVLCAEPRR